MLITLEIFERQTGHAGKDLAQTLQQAIYMRSKRFIKPNYNIHIVKSKIL